MKISVFLWFLKSNKSLVAELPISVLAQCHSPEMVKVDLFEKVNSHLTQPVRSTTTIVANQSGREPTSQSQGFVCSPYFSQVNDCFADSEGVLDLLSMHYIGTFGWMCEHRNHPMSVLRTCAPHKGKNVFPRLSPCEQVVLALWSGKRS